MKWIAGYIFDAWNGARFMLNEFYESVDRAMDVFGDDDWPDRDSVLA